MKYDLTLALATIAPLPGDRGPNGGERKEHPQRRRRQRREAVACIEALAAFDLHGLPAIEHVEEDDGYAQGLGSSFDPDQAVDQQIASKALALKAMIDTDHRDEACRDLTMAGPCPGERRWQVAIIDQMGIDGVKTDDLAVERYHHAQPQIVRTGELFGGSRKEIIDRRPAGTKARAIMMGGIEGLDPVARRRRFGHRVEIVA
jgi:hypothetical protein